MCGYNPYAIYEYFADLEHEKLLNGCEDMTNDEYYDWLQDRKEFADQDRFEQQFIKERIKK